MFLIPWEFDTETLILVDLTNEGKCREVDVQGMID